MISWFTIKPRRRKLLGKQKILYSDMDSSMKEGKIDEFKKQQFLEEFKEKKLKEKRQRLILVLILVLIGIIAISLLFILKPSQLSTQ